jgi:hypothetical protein
MSYPLEQWPNQSRRISRLDSLEPLLEIAHQQHVRTFERFDDKTNNANNEQREGKVVPKTVSSQIE